MDVLERIDRLEARLARVERHLYVADAQAPAPVAPSPAAPSFPTTPAAAAIVAIPAPPASAPAPRREPLRTAHPAWAAQGRSTPPKAASKGPREAGDLERVLGVMVLGRVGVAALLLAASYFANLAYKSFDPTLRVISIYALAGTLIGVGAWLRPRVAAKYVAILWGGGVALAYMAGAVAKLRYDLVGSVPATLLLVGACALGQWLAKAARLEVLAIVALAGAFAAPVLVGGPEDARTVLLVYLLTIHGWAVFTEAKWGWKGARLVAAIGTSIVGILWLAAHGAADVSTYVHVHLYLLALTAPEWIAGLRGRGVSVERTLFVLLPLAFAEAWCVGTVGGRSLYALAVIAGAGWAALAIATRLRSSESTPWIRGLTRLAGPLLALGAVLVWNRIDSQAQWALASVAVVGVLSVLGARWLRAGEGAAAFAGLLSLLLLLDTSVEKPWTLVAIAAPLALLLHARFALARVAGLFIAAAAMFIGLYGMGYLDARWLAVAFGAASLLMAVARLRAAHTKDALLALFADIGPAILAAAWAACAFGGAFEPVPRAFANPGTLAALAIVAGFAIRGPWPKRARDGFEGLPWLAGAALGSVLALAGWREVHAALGSVSAADTRASVETIYMAVVTVVIFLAARGTRSIALQSAALIALAVSVAKGFTDAATAGGAWTAAAEIGALCGATWIAARKTWDASDLAPKVVPFVAIALGALWCVFSAHPNHRFHVETFIANPRMLAGGTIVALLVWLRRGRGGGAAQPGAMGLSAAAAILGFVVGLAEVHRAVETIAFDQWRAALVSVYATLYAAGVLALGFRRKAADLRYLALAGFAAVVLKVGFHDLATVETPYRILVTGVLGGVLLVAAYAYARRGREAPE